MARAILRAPRRPAFRGDPPGARPGARLSARTPRAVARRSRVPATRLRARGRIARVARPCVGIAAAQTCRSILVAMNSSLFRRAADADVCLLLEGTFPYVRGGVSSWVNQMIRSYPGIRFAIAFVGSREEDYHGAAYELPDNVVHFEAHYRYEAAPADKQMAREIPGDA